MITVGNYQELITAYEGGERYFVDCDLGLSSLQKINLKGIVFARSFLSCDFTGANLENAKFEMCNLKTAIFCNANLKNGMMIKCSVECLDLKGANLENFVFSENYYMGVKLDQSDLGYFC